MPLSSFDESSPPGSIVGHGRTPRALAPGLGVGSASFGELSSGCRPARPARTSLVPGMSRSAPPRPPAAVAEGREQGRDQQTSGRRTCRSGRRSRSRPRTRGTARGGRARASRTSRPARRRRPRSRGSPAARPSALPRRVGALGLLPDAADDEQVVVGAEREQQDADRERHEVRQIGVAERVRKISVVSPKVAAIARALLATSRTGATSERRKIASSTRLTRAAAIPTRAGRRGRARSSRAPAPCRPRRGRGSGQPCGREERRHRALEPARGRRRRQRRTGGRGRRRSSGRRCRSASGRRARIAAGAAACPRRGRRRPPAARRARGRAGGGAARPRRCPGPGARSRWVRPCPR